MTKSRSMRRRASERGEGNARLVVFLVVLALVGYLGVQNVPTYFNVQNLKHDLSELARGAAAQRVPVERVKRQADEIARKYDTRAEEVVVTANGYNIQITVKSVKQIDLLVTKDSGGAATQPKLDAARERGIGVVLVRRPARPEVDTVATVAGVVARVEQALGAPAAQAG